MVTKAMQRRANKYDRETGMRERWANHQRDDKEDGKLVLYFLNYTDNSFIKNFFTVIFINLNLEEQREQEMEEINRRIKEERERMEEMRRRQIDIQSNDLASRIVSVKVDKRNQYESEEEDSGDRSFDYDNFRRRPSTSSSSEENEQIPVASASRARGSYRDPPVNKTETQYYQQRAPQSHNPQYNQYGGNANQERDDRRFSETMSFGGVVRQLNSYQPE